MNKQLLKQTLGWGIVLWLIGYVLGIALFPVVSSNMIGWVIMPIGTIIALLVLLKKIKSEMLQHYIWLALGWTVIAVVLDYFLLVKVFKPADGYYKLDVYIYYALTLALPIFVGWYKKSYRKEGSLAA